MSKSPIHETGDVTTPLQQRVARNPHCPGRRVARCDLICLPTRGGAHADRSTAEGDGRRAVPQDHHRRRVGHRLGVGPRDPAHRREDIVEVLQHVAISAGLPCGHCGHGRARDGTSQTVFAYLSGIRTGLRHDATRRTTGGSTIGRPNSLGIPIRAARAGPPRSADTAPTAIPAGRPITAPNGVAITRPKSPAGRAASCRDTTA